MRRAIGSVLVLLALAAPAAAQQGSIPQQVLGSAPAEPPMTREVLARGRERYDIF